MRPLDLTVKRTVIFLAWVALTLTTPSSIAPVAESRTAWFENARFGMFIHWNGCAALAGRYLGEPVRQSEYAEWIRSRNRVRRDDWDAGIKQFHVTPEVVDGWAEAAKMAGMKYVIFVAKHHDGLAFWPSKVSNYTLNKLARVKFDVIATLKKACDRRDLKLCLYYSHWQDWEDPHGYGNFWEFNSKDPTQFKGRDDLFFYGGEQFRDNLSAAQFDDYWRRKSMPQVQELMDAYHPAIMWFDCWRDRGDTDMTALQVGDLLAQIRRTDPLCLVNSRIGISTIGGPAGVDYETTGDNEFPDRRIDHPWESPITFAESWGFSRDDQAWHPTTYFVRNLVRNVSLGGNLVVNIGPEADGSIPEEAMVRLREIGRCIRDNRDGFYGCGYTPFFESSQDWGLTTTRGDRTLFLHVFDWPVDGVVRVNGLKAQATAVRLCGNDSPLRFEQTGTSVHVFGPKSRPFPYDTVIRVDLGAPIAADNDTVGEIAGGSIALQASRAALVGVKNEKPVAGSTKLPFQIGGWDAPGAVASWSIFVPSAGRRRVTVGYACAVSFEAGGFRVSAGPGCEVAGKVEATMSNWTEFRPFVLGEIDFPKAGPYVVTVRPDSKPDRELFKLLWVHLGPPRT